MGKACGAIVPHSSYMYPPLPIICMYQSFQQDMC